MSKYQTLITILDELRKEAPIQYKKYYPLESDNEKTNQARSQAFIHLFLKVKFGLLTFLERESYITDGTDDGGVDGYFIDKENEHIYFIQSKFRNSEENFENVNIELDEILKMELDRITKGETIGSNGREYNPKIQSLIKSIDEISNKPKWKEIVIVLANVKDKHRDKINHLTQFPTEIFNFDKVYDDLIFPVVSGTFFRQSELKITINVNPNTKNNIIDYDVDTAIKECNIRVLFVPTIEIAKILYKYKNSILKFNPRSYLDLAGGSVNSKIYRSITDITTNEFALYNNGITMLSDKTYYSDRTGRKREAEMIVTNPQIINGGQTAFTLSRIYEDKLNTHSEMEVFENKEVLLKIITFEEDLETKIDEESKLKLIEAISKATNDQTAVTDADRTSNDKIQIEVQESIFKKFGYFYERKRGEFGDGLRSKYIDRSRIVDRETFIRISYAINGHPGQARRVGTKFLFKKRNINLTLPDINNIDKYFFGYKVFGYLNEIQKSFDKDLKNRFGQAQYGNSLRYGKIAVVTVVSRQYAKNGHNSDFNSAIIELTKIVLESWKEFEEHIQNIPRNEIYFIRYREPETNIETIELNYDNYYKSNSIITDLNSFFNI
ncbi:AIPR family protein [Mucilaginibacter segetis]|uniref:AIPR family protein n=1 Tax=Mucilaginibacter segetis TaxID=2793071 RepID=A0A934PUB3_9SPHI|nr:AIPR family protein [Mucilaginibacter segetis]MBK0379682.1 AIPR family protein [Mucilaginibacter segetis]